MIFCHMKNSWKLLYDSLLDYRILTNKNYEILVYYLLSFLTTVYQQQVCIMFQKVTNNYHCIQLTTTFHWKISTPNRLINTTVNGKYHSAIVMQLTNI